MKQVISTVATLPLTPTPISTAISQLVLAVFTIQPVRAVPQFGPCPVPEALDPLALLLHDLVYLLITFGILAAIAGYSWAGIRYMWDDIEGHRRAKRLIQNVTIGLLILLFAQPLVSYLVVRLAGC